MAQGGQLVTVKQDSGSGKFYVEGNEVTIGGGSSTIFPILPAFQYEWETDNVSGAFTVAPSERVKKSMNRAIKRLKAGGVWPKLIGFWRVNADLQSTCVNWRSPGKYNLTVSGSPTFTPYVSLKSTGSTQYLNTGIPLNSLSNTSCSIGFYSRTAGAFTTSDIGTKDATNGLTISALSSVGSRMAARVMSAANTTLGTANSDWDGYGFHAVSRVDAINATPYKGPTSKGSVALASATITATNPIVFLASSTSGTITASDRAQSCWFIGKGMTDAEMAVLHDVVQQLETEFSSGHLLTFDAGVSPSALSYDLVIYGATSAAAVAAYQAIRSGLSVAIVGGWRDRSLGGMSTNGLGFADIDDKTSVGGLPKWLIAQVQAAQGTPNTDWTFEPVILEKEIRKLFDPRTANGVDAPVFWSDGLASVAKSGAAITSITTVDGRTYYGKVFMDCSYEGDLMAAAGVSYFVGREKAGTGQESRNGFRGVTTTDGGDHAQFGSSTYFQGTPLNIDPWTTPGDPTSALLPWISGINGIDTPAVGAQDTRIQAFNFRMTLTNDPARIRPFPSSAPAGYATINYEPLLRFFAIKPTAVLAEVLKYSYVGGTAGNTGVFDLNFDGGQSTDLIGASAKYIEATYTGRESIWVLHRNWILGLFYCLQYDSDPRIPASVRTSALKLGLDQRHYCDPYKTDPSGWPRALYVREGRRMVSDIVWTGNDINATDGTVPRSIKTIAVGSYAMDSHQTMVLADEYTPGSWRTWNEGNVFLDAGGANLRAPLPYDIIVPKELECTNLYVIFGVSATHIAFGNIRMEFTSMMMAQSAAIAAKLAIASGTSVQAVDYPTLRAAILSSPTLPGETVPVLPQTN